MNGFVSSTSVISFQDESSFMNPAKLSKKVILDKKYETLSQTSLISKADFFGSNKKSLNSLT